MNKTKRKLVVFCTIAQFLYGLIFVVASCLLLFRWLVEGNVDTFLPNLFNALLEIFGNNQLLTKILAPLIALFLSVILLACSNYMIKKPFDKKNNQPRKQTIFVVVAFVVNVIFALILALMSFADDGEKFVLPAIIVGLIAIMESVAIFLPNSVLKDNSKEGTTSTATTEKDNAKEQRQTKTEQPTNTNNEYMLTAEKFEERSNELFRLAKNNKISDSNLVDCLNDLMGIPISSTYDVKINCLNKFSSNGMLTPPQISALICKAIVSRNSANIKKRIRYTEFLYSKRLINDTDYSNAIRALMSMQ